MAKWANFDQVIKSGIGAMAEKNSEADEEQKKLEKQESQHKNDNQIISNQLNRAIDRKRCHSINVAQNSASEQRKRKTFCV